MGFICDDTTTRRLAIASRNRSRLAHGPGVLGVPIRPPFENANAEQTTETVPFPSQIFREKVEERLNRIEWYLREYGRPPTWDELMAIRRFKTEF